MFSFLKHTVNIPTSMIRKQLPCNISLGRLFSGAMADVTSHTYPGLIIIIYFRYGCCSDKYTYSQGPNFEGCPETRTGYSLPYYPRDFVASKLDETTGDVRLSLSWSPPQDDSVVDLYVVCLNFVSPQ